MAIGHKATFDTGEREGDVYFEYGYSSTSQRAFSEFVLPICNGRARIGLQITSGQIAYFLDTQNANGNDAALELDKFDLWFKKQRTRKCKGTDFCEFEKGFRYEYVSLDDDCSYDVIASMLSDALKIAINNKDAIEKIAIKYV